jgi:hypothetical protein
MDRPDDVYELFFNKLKDVCSIYLGYHDGRYFNSIKVEGQLPGEDLCATIARHMCDALTDHGITDKQ